MRISLRWKIMLITVLPLVTLAFATLWVVNRNVTHRAHEALQDELRRASAVLENLLTASAQTLAVTGRVIVEDPKFFSVLTLPGRHDDPQLRATVSAVARDFNAITQDDLFEVADAQGRLVASVGRDVSGAEGRARLVSEALAGRVVTGVLVQGDVHHLASAAPVYAGGRIVGVLLLGARIGGDLAERLRRLTRSEVTFLSHRTITGSTLADANDRSALLRTLGGRGEPSSARDGTMMEVRGQDDRFLTLVRPLPRATVGQGQHYVIQRSLDEETAFLRDIQKGLVELGVIAVLAALLAGFLIAERITTPLQRLAHSAEEMQRGNFNDPITVHSRDEIGVLASSFEDMRLRQREYIQSLQEVTRIKSEFINVASHELRTPISVIRGYHELMLDGRLGAVTPEQHKALEATLRGLDALTRIAEDATRVTNTHRDGMVLRRADCNVAELVDEAIAHARALGVGRSVTVEADIPASVEAAHVDGPKLVQAITHLVANGIRFTPDGGRVTVRVIPERRGLAFEVADTGIGIDPARQGHLFDGAFMVRDALNHHSSSTLEFHSAGLGLGLSIARGIAEAHGGHLSVESVPEAGSTFTLRVPSEPAGELGRAA